MAMPYKPIPHATLMVQEIENNKKLEQRAIAEKKMRVATIKEQEALTESTLREMHANTSRKDKYISFTEAVRTQLMEYAIFDVYFRAVNQINTKLGRDLIQESSNPNVMHSIVFEFIREQNGPSRLINTLGSSRSGYYLNNIHSAIKESMTAIIENADENDTDTFKVTDELMGKFKNKLNECGTDELAEMISNRVTDSIEEFIEKNAQDKNAIVSTLTATKEKIDSLETDNESVKETYTMLGKRMVSDIRQRPNNLFGQMVHSLAKSALDNKSLHENFIENAHLNMPKIVSKVGIVYSFLETVSVMKLVKVDEAYVQEILDSFSEFDN